MSFFFNPKPIGKNSDIERHREEEAHIRAKLAEAELEGDELRIRVWKNFLHLLLVSKAEVTSKIGRKK